MTRGNQRELARQKNIKKQQEMKKGKAANDKDGNKGLSLEERRRRDAEILRLKQQKALEKKQQEQGKASA
ncbi:small EDRK-rich factor 2-like [Argiope bruennichi]|uniref:Modifier of protein aggregation 4 like protein n=1 Tax=Argiope bruennichi TaxID=94029 RepID=A0A8T0EPA8_ARGBR|nr:small EDRK-rich factor 2-like [Argiope bruennichi]KAF8777201.1 Modifier of protein aggregation 4 like protein [Argiope bruennichi]